MRHEAPGKAFTWQGFYALILWMKPAKSLPYYADLSIGLLHSTLYTLKRPDEASPGQPGHVRSCKDCIQPYKG